MKIGSLIAGIVLLIVAIIGFTSSANTVSQGQTLPGQFGQLINSQYAQQYQQANYSEYAFGGLGVIGLGLLIYGAAARNKSKFICGYCDYETEIEDNLYVHYERQHRKDNLRQEADDNMSSKEKKNLRYLGILKERLAKGEISKEDYDELKKEFESK